MGALVSLIWLAAIVVMIAALWKIFEKAGKPGWAALIPFYNIYIMLELAGKPGWWLVLFLIPLINLIMTIIVTIAFAAKFGKSGGFAAGMIVLPFIFYPLLAFSDERRCLRLSLFMQRSVIIQGAKPSPCLVFLQAPYHLSGSHNQCLYCLNTPDRLFYPQYLDNFSNAGGLGTAGKCNAQRLTNLRHLPAILRADFLKDYIKLSRRGPRYS
jgi:hypothetical protein